MINLELRPRQRGREGLSPADVIDQLPRQRRRRANVQSCVGILQSKQRSVHLVYDVHMVYILNAEYLRWSTFSVHGHQLQARWQGWCRGERGSSADPQLPHHDSNAAGNQGTAAAARCRPVLALELWLSCRRLVHAPKRFLNVVRALQISLMAAHSEQSGVARGPLGLEVSGLAVGGRARYFLFSGTIRSSSSPSRPDQAGQLGRVDGESMAWGMLACLQLDPPSFLKGGQAFSSAPVRRRAFELRCM